MKNAHVLFACLISITLSSCAFGMGPRRESCEPKIPPTRPPKNLCISNGDGSCEFYNSITHKNEHVPNTVNFVCKDISSYNREQEFIDDILELLKR